MTLLENKAQGQSPTGTIPSINWQDSLPVQRLLDVISSILAEEYIMTAKQNPTVFSERLLPQLLSCESKKRGRNDSGMDSRFRGNDNEGHE